MDNLSIFCYYVIWSDLIEKREIFRFFDAIMAIIMTLGIIGFAQPSGTDWSDLEGLGFQILTYAVSFFWLGVLWIHIHTLWHEVEIISKSVIFVNVILLFFSSMIPFLVTYLGKNITETVPQVLYGLDVVIITISNQISSELLKKDNPDIAPW